MKKILLSLSVIFLFIAYSFHEQSEGSRVKIPASAPSSGSSSPSPGNTSIQYKDGSYTGNVTDAFYGNVQVKAVIQGGKIADVQFLQYPNDRQTSVDISNAAMPVLKQEAIQNQSATVDTVSGATQTSEAFRQSLQSALEKAKA